jgi:hypothetical protein
MVGDLEQGLRATEAPRGERLARRMVPRTVAERDITDEMTRRQDPGR